MPSVFDWLKSKKRSLKVRKGIKYTPFAKWIILSFVVLLFFFILKYSGQIIHPFIWAMITAYLFAPIIYWLESKSHIPRSLWIILLYVVLGLLIYWALSYALPVANNELSEIVGSDKMSNVSFLGHVEGMGRSNIYGFDIDYKEIVSKFRGWLRMEISSLAVPVFIGFMERLILISAFLIITFYMLMDGEKYVRLFLLLFPIKYRRELTDVAGEINETMGAYIRGQIILILIMSLASWMVLSVLKVRFAIILCMATGILEVVPVIGPVVATSLASLVAFYQPEVAWGLTNITLAMIVIASYFLLRQMEDLIIIPNIVGKFIHVHPVIVLFAFFVGAKVGGVLGMFLALPISAVIKVLFNFFYPKLIG